MGLEYGQAILVKNSERPRDMDNNESADMPMLLYVF